MIKEIQNESELVSIWRKLNDVKYFKSALSNCKDPPTLKNRKKITKILSEFVNQSIYTCSSKNEIIEEILKSENILDEILLFSFAKCSNADYCQKLKVELEIAAIFRNLMKFGDWNEMKTFLKKENESKTNMTRLLEIIFGMLETKNTEALDISLKFLKTIFEKAQLNEDSAIKQEIFGFKNGFFCKKIGDLKNNKIKMISKLVCFSFFEILGKKFLVEAYQTFFFPQANELDTHCIHD